MRRQTLMLVMPIVIILVIFSVYAGWKLVNSNQPNKSPEPTETPVASDTPEVSPTVTPSPTPEASATPEVSLQEQVRDAVMNYIKTYHYETAQFMQNLVWTGGRATPSGLVGAETYSYQSLGWNMTLQYPVVPNAIYTVTAEYTSPISQVTPTQTIVAWRGTWQNGDISETSYNNAQFSTQEQVRTSVMAYLKANHPESVQFMKNLNWTGGRVTEPLLVGSETYTYLAQGWNVTMRYPVVPNPVYEVTADYSAAQQGPSIPYRIIWQGTWQNGTITETKYVFAQ